MKNVFDMTSEEYSTYLQNEQKRLNLCPNCFGSGFLAEGGLFSNRYKCEFCNGTGKDLKNDEPIKN